MNDYKLDFDEVILASEECSIKKAKGTFSKGKGKIIVTTKRVIWCITGVFDSVKSSEFSSVKDIKMYDNRPQAVVEYKKGDYHLTIYFTDREEVFVFKYSYGAYLTARKIDEAINGPPKKEKTSEGEGFLAGAVKSAAKAISSAIKSISGNDNNQDSEKKDEEVVKTVIVNKTPKKRVSVKCIGCRNQLSGYEGEEVVCEYCNTSQVLK